MTQFAAFDAPYSPPDEVIAKVLLAEADFGTDAEARIDRTATQLIAAIRAPKRGVAGGLGGIEDFLREYSLSTREGLALMVLAEALLRVPDAATADRLIEDKLSHGDWAHHITRSDALLVTASAWALGLTARILQPGETPEGVLAGLVKRVGLPSVRTATRQAMRLMGGHFVLGETIEAALVRAKSSSGRLYRYSFDMLGEGARTQADAERYFAAYAKAIAAIGAAAGDAPLPDRPGISVKLSALHPRYEAVSRARVLSELVPQVVKLAEMAKHYDLNFTVDAEEADRLELSLEVIDAVVAHASLAHWDGFGLAIQAYQKRAGAVIAHIVALAEKYDRRFMVRLVKGAYWDTEVKRAQERGLDDYPVFTRKAMTDLNYLACAKQLLAARARIYPQFATHNALSVASILEAAGGNAAGFEFQRLHGMGDELYHNLLSQNPRLAARTYAPVGDHVDLLAYLVRRLLENGANSSFVSLAGDRDVPISRLLERPQAQIGVPGNARNPHLPLPKAIYAPARDNSAGLEFGSAAALNGLLEEVRKVVLPKAPISSLILDTETRGTARGLKSPIDGQEFGQVVEADAKLAAKAMQVAQAGFARWSRLPVGTRAEALDRMADLMQARRAHLLALLQVEAGKTLDDAVAELREAIDFCRFYAAEARTALNFVPLPGPTGESNVLGYRGRGVFVCISPWNFPLAIFIGQVVAALVAGNSVVAKPAEATPMIAHMAVQMLHEAGVERGALQLVLGNGVIGGALVADPICAGVAFTGSTATAWRINRALAARDCAIAPLIAETGGVNTMVVDATALPEQVADDVVTSAFRSTGQRCSALRLLCVQEDIADKLIAMIIGATRELKIGDPRDITVHVGPVIDKAAKTRLMDHIAAMSKSSRLLYAGTVPGGDLAEGIYVAPHIIEIGSVRDLRAEVFGPVLHVVRYSAKNLDSLLNDIEASGYGLTLGVHSRIDAQVDKITARLNVGNCYINRNMIGAVVGTQPFGGSGLSGTGPKAGGPNYLKRFSTEQVISINTAAAGGNASLIAMSE